VGEEDPDDDELVIFLPVVFPLSLLVLLLADMVVGDDVGLSL
jgi:hypothetical protein